MKLSNWSKILLFVFVAILLLVPFIFLLLSTQDKPLDTVVDTSFGWKYPVAMFPDVGPKSKDLLAYSDIRDPGGIPQGLPVRLKIPIIGVDSAIEDAFITPDGRMDVPAGTINVAWFALGPHPGEEGSAVIGGHYGFYEANKGPTVFYNLDKLKTGDKVYIEDDRGETLAFVVRKIELFDPNADATTVFTSNDGLAHLNLITCEGIWNQVNDSYPDRRVVFTDAIPSEGAIEVITKAQSQLAAKPIAETNVKPVVDSTESALGLTKPPPTQIILDSAKKMYATPSDGLVTSLLLFSIIIISFNIYRRKLKISK